MNPQPVEIVGAVLFAVAVAHTFLTKHFEHLARWQPSHAGIWHLLGEVEAVFGFWAMVFIIYLAAYSGTQAAVQYLEGLKFTEPMFVFVVMVIAASKPILDLASLLTMGLARLLPLPQSLSFFFVTLFMTPLIGSFITEPAAMTLAALMLREHIFSKPISTKLKYVTLGVLFVNISIGGTLTPYAAPPVLMVAAKWNWDLMFMISTFGWKAAVAVFSNAALATLVFRRELCSLPASSTQLKPATPAPLIFVHLAFLAGVVKFAHHVAVFMGLFLFFLGVAHAYKQYQDRLILREGLMVAFFLAGLVTLGAQQAWWLEPALKGLSPTALYFGATALTAITDNAALTYLGSLVPGVTDSFKYALVAGAVTGGGLTVIANAPNPAGFAILRGNFDQGAISPMGLFAAAFLPTVVAILAFQCLPS